MKYNFKSETEFIEAIAPAAQKACKKYGYLPSVLIAQACHENGFGIPAYWDNPEIKYLLKYNNMVGQKAELLTSTWYDYSVWPGKSFNKITPEEEDGEIHHQPDDFRKFDDIEQSFCDYILFLLYASEQGYHGKPKYGPEVVNIKDPAKLIQEVKNRGYATGSTYPKAVMRIVNEHNLTKYDDLTNVKPSEYIPPALKGKKAEKQIIDITARNRGQVPRARSEKIKFIVCHYLGVPNADNPDLYDGGKGGHYNIERNGKIYKAADPKTAVVWHCGGELQGSGGHKFFRICTNYNSIGIECGVCYDGSRRDPDGDDPNWYFTTETQESLVFLVSKLMDEYNIPFEHVIRHYDVTGKLCPAPYVHNNKHRTSWTWNEFKANLKAYREGKPAPADELRKGDRGEAVKTLQTMLNAIGHNCGEVDGVYGNQTENAVKSFQASIGYETDGVYGPNTKKALETAYNARGTLTVPKILSGSKDVMDTARVERYTYGDSHAIPPTSDKVISCDRMIDKMLWDAGYTDQRPGGEVVSTLDGWLTKHGFVRSTSPKDIKKGSILLVKAKSSKTITHAFVVVRFDPDTWKTDRYDAGTQKRIETVQPLKNVAWAYKKDDIIVYNLPEEPTPTPKPEPKPEPKPKTNWKPIGTATATVNYLNVRETPNGKVLRQVMKGNRFEVDGKTKGEWIRVKVVDKIGWIYGKYVKYD